MTTVTTATSSGPYTAAGQTTFAVTFQSLSASEIAVYLDGALVTTGYVFNRNSDGTGSVVFTAPQSGQVLIRSAANFKQNTAFDRFGAFYPDLINDPLDRLARLSLYVNEVLGRTLRVPFGATAPELPSAASMAGKFLVGDGNGGFIPSSGTGADAGLRADWTTVLGFQALKDMLKDMRLKVSSVRTRLGRFSDAFTDTTGINAGASAFYAYDSRKVVGPDRTYSSSVFFDTFVNLSKWTTITNGTAISTGNPDPNIAHAVQLNTGATVGSIAQVRTNAGVIPASFGVSIIMGMGTAGGADEALECQFQNANGHLLKMRFFLNTFQFFYNGTWNTAFTSGAWTAGGYTEFWAECVFNTATNYTVRLFAGTQELPGFTGNLPGGNAGENGFVNLIQNTSTNANRIGNVANIQVGSSALPQNMSLVSVAQDVVTEPTVISMALLVEDVSLQTVINSDIKAWISKDGGVTWYQVTLVNYGEVAAGILTITCPVYLLAGQATLPLAAGAPHSVCGRITSANGHYFSVQGRAWKVDA